MKKILVALFIFIGSINLQAQSNNTFFQKSNLMTLGVYYYPEHWDSSQWERDIKTIANMGFEFIHLAEFAWIDLEPEEGKYNFAWLDKVFKLAEKYKLKIILCTPTITPPVWLGIKHPEIYIMNASYQRQEHGTRAMNSLSDSVYKAYSVKIITTLAKHYGSNKNIIGWQLDNEPEAKSDYSPSAQSAFRKWLKLKYSSVKMLNMAWGTEFWSQKYASFDEVLIPNTQLVGWWGTNPHALLDYKRFSADIQADYLNLQAETLRKYIQNNQFITTNYTAGGTQADPRRAEKLDFISFTAYPNGGTYNVGPEGFRLGNPLVLSFANDFFRPYSGVTGVMELQPGQVNWGETNPLLLPGTVRMWLYHCFASGCSFACTYRFRQINYSSEQYHAGIMKQDGVTPSQGGKDFQQVAKEMQLLRKNYNASAKYPEKLAARKTALLWGFDNIWSLDRQRQTNQWDAKVHFQKYLETAKSLGAPVDIIYEDDKLEDYKYVIAPAFELVDSTLINKWKHYVTNGGNLVLTTRTGVKDRQGHIWQAKWAAPIYQLINAEIEGYDQLLPDGNGEVTSGILKYRWNNWADIITDNNPEEIIATYTNQFYSGKAAVIKHKIGKGTIIYVGVDTDDGALEHDILKAIYLSTGASVEDYPEGVYVQWRDGFWIAINYSSDNQIINIPASAKLIIGESNLKPAEAVIWTE